MSIGPMGFVSSLAGLPAQARAAEADRSKGDVAAGDRQAESLKRAEDAAGIGVTDGEHHETQERDADGRRLWERDARNKRDADASAPDADHPTAPTSDEAGGRLDLTA